jgi:sulfur-carrier protein
MTVTFHIPAALREFTAGSSTVEIQSPGQTLTDALAALWMKYPGVRDRVLNEQDQIRQHINIFVGNENVRYTGGLATQVPQQSQISIVPAVSGGLGRLVDNPTPLQIPTLC